MNSPGDRGNLAIQAKAAPYMTLVKPSCKHLSFSLDHPAKSGTISEPQSFKPMDATACCKFLEPSEMGAYFSGDRRHRYTLWRRWGRSYQGLVAFVGLNPSTATEVTNDPTVRRCIGFAKDWGFDGMMMLNAFAFRATDPRDMKAQPDPVGPENDEAILRSSALCSKIVCCWGNHGAHLGRGPLVEHLLNRHNIEAWCLGRTKVGHPKHPLYLAKDTQLEPFARRSAHSFCSHVTATKNLNDITK